MKEMFDCKTDEYIYFHYFKHIDVTAVSFKIEWQLTPAHCVNC